jgi:amino acid transporter
VSRKPIAHWLAIGGLIVHLAFWLSIAAVGFEDDLVTEVVCGSMLFVYLPLGAAVVAARLQHWGKLREIWIPLGIWLGILTIILAIWCVWHYLRFHAGTG